MNDRSPRLAEIINYALDLFRSGLYVGRPVRVQTVNADSQTVDVQPMLMDSYVDASDEVQKYTLPVIPSVPILFQEGGDFIDTFPIAAGDCGWLLFADRSLDQWQQKGNGGDPVDPLTEFRHHPAAKGLFIPGGRSVADAFQEWDPQRRVIGKQGGPRIAFTGSQIDLGVDHQETATEQAVCGTTYRQNEDQWFDNVAGQAATAGLQLQLAGDALTAAASANAVPETGGALAEAPLTTVAQALTAAGNALNQLTQMLTQFSQNGDQYLSTRVKIKAES